MRCPFCGHNDTAVKDSRTTEDFGAIRRRRFCSECGARFTTFERIQLRDLTVIKKDGNRAPFDRDKLVKAVMSAIHKRSIPSERIERVINGIVRRLETTGESEIPSHSIGEMVMQALINLDPVAYIRFASVYRDFHTIDDFVAFISQMEEHAINTAQDS